MSTDSQIANLEYAALELIKRETSRDHSPYGIDPGETFNGDRTILFPKGNKTVIIADCYVLGIEDIVREDHLTCGPCILLVQHAYERHFAGRFETVADALKAIDPMTYRSQHELPIICTPQEDEDTVF